MAQRSRWTMERGTLWVKALDALAAVNPVTPRIPAVMDEVRQPEALAQAMGLAESDLVRQRFASGRRCFAARVGDQIAAYGWVSRNRECVGELEREMHMQPDEAYIWDCATLPPYRQQRLYSALLATITSTLQTEGVRRIWIGTALTNQPSLQGFANAGFRPALRLTYLRVLNLSVMWTSTSAEVAPDISAAARQAFAARHEHAWGTLAVGRLPPEPICAS